MSENFVRMELDDAEKLAMDACLSAGASLETAHSLVRAIISAEESGNSAVGFNHLPDYLAGFRAGRIDGFAQPEVTFPGPALVQVDAKGSIAQLGFDRAFTELTTRAGAFGIALFSQFGSYTTGELGYYPLRLAKAGFAAFAATNGPALMTVEGARAPVYCTNPIAFAAPRAEGAPLLIDQATSATAFVKIREAAARGEKLPPGVAVDETWQPTTDPSKAMRGALLAFGGKRGANIALLAEIMAGGLGCGNWSMDSPDFTEGNVSPGAGLVVIAIAPAMLDRNFTRRLEAQLRRLAGQGVHIPGEKKGAAARAASRSGLRLSRQVLARIAGSAGGATAPDTGPATTRHGTSPE